MVGAACECEEQVRCCLQTAGAWRRQSAGWQHPAWGRGAAGRKNQCGWKGDDNESGCGGAAKDLSP